MFLIPLSQIASVELVVQALRIAGGQTDCSTCPAQKVCMKQCLTIADAVQQMLDDGQLPTVGVPEMDEAPEDEKQPEAAMETTPATKPTLKIIK